MAVLTEFQWIITAIGWTIIHSLWQFSIIGLIWLAGISMINKTNATSRYLCAATALILMLATSGVTLFSELQYRGPIDNEILYTEKPITVTADSKGTTNITPILQAEQYNQGTVITPPTPMVQKWLSASVLAFLVGAWCCGILFFGLRFLLQWLSMRRLTTKGSSVFTPEQLAIFKQLKINIGIKKSITFLQSTSIATPLTFGHFKPVILLPLGMISGFPPKQIEAIILHELAHIRRNDFLINLIQIWLEVLFFYHPLVWIISKKVRTIREELCDDEVISINKNKILYAETLLNLQKYFFHHKNQLIMNATNNKSELTNRVHRLFQTQPNTSHQSGRLNAYLMGLLMLVAILGYAFSTSSSSTISVAADKMNVFYLGIDNPITVAVSDVNTENVTVESNDVTLKDIGHGHYIVNATKEGEAVLNIIAEGHAPKKVSFRVKSIPNPTAMINNSTGGTISAEEMKNAKTVDVVLKDFVFDAKCTIAEFNMVRVGLNEDPVMAINHSATFSNLAKRQLQKLKAKDILYFDGVKCKCPGDVEIRPVNSMVFKIK